MQVHHLPLRPAKMVSLVVQDDPRVLGGVAGLDQRETAVDCRSKLIPNSAWINKALRKPGVSFAKPQTSPGHPDRCSNYCPEQNASGDEDTSPHEWFGERLSIAAFGVFVTTWCRTPIQSSTRRHGCGSANAAVCHFKEVPVRCKSINADTRFCGVPLAIALDRQCPSVRLVLRP